MATTKSVEKRPGETITVEEDFTDRLDGATIDSDNISAVITDADTDDDVTADILVTGSLTLTGNVISCRVTGGDAGKSYLVAIATGLTSGNTEFTQEQLLNVTDSPTADTLLTTLAHLKRRLQITDTSSDAVLLDLLTIASDYFKRRVGRDLVYAERTEVVYYEEDPSITQSTRLPLNEWPVRSITSVILRTDPSDVSPTTVAAADIAFDKEGFVWLRNGSVFLQYPNENVITYRAGYTRIPADIQGAVESIGAFFYRLLTREGVTSERIGDYAWSKRSLSDFPASEHFEVPDEIVEGVIGRYTRRDIGF